MVNKKIFDFLVSLELTPHEAHIYEGLLRIKEGTVKEISDYLGINRITTHDSIQSLLEKGLVTEKQIGARKRTIMATSPEKLEYIIEQKEKKIEGIRATLPKIIQEMSVFKSSSPNNIFNVRFYEGKIGIMQVYKEVLEAETVYSFADLERYYELFPNTKELWLKAFKKNPNRQMWDLLVDSKTSRTVASKKVDRYYCKILPSSDLFQGMKFTDFLIYQHKVAIIKFDTRNPVATVIESQDVTASLRALHQTMWSIIPR